MRKVYVSRLFCTFSISCFQSRLSVRLCALPADVTAVRLQNLISWAFLNDHEDISLVTDNGKTRLSYVIP